MNAAAFCHNFESGLGGMLNAAMQQARNTDTSGEAGIHRLGAALRRERHENECLRARLAELEGDLFLARETINALI